MEQTQKKYKRTVVGSVIKSNDTTKSDYMKFRLKDKNGRPLVGDGTLSIKDGDTLSVESKAYQLASAKKAFDAGKISEEILTSIRERLEKQPDFVRGEIIHVTKST